MEDFVPFEIAKKLKEKEFDWETSNVYERNAIACRYEDYPKPTISQVLKWLREEKKIHIGFGYSPRKKWRYVVMYMDDRFYNRTTLAVDGFLKIEQAALAGIEYVLDNLI